MPTFASVLPVAVADTDEKHARALHGNINLLIDEAREQFRLFSSGSYIVVVSLSLSLRLSDSVTQTLALAYRPIALLSACAVARAPSTSSRRNI